MQLPVRESGLDDCGNGGLAAVRCPRYISHRIGPRRPSHKGVTASAAGGHRRDSATRHVDGSRFGQFSNRPEAGLTQKLIANPNCDGGNYVHSLVGGAPRPDDGLRHCDDITKAGSVIAPRRGSVVVATLVAYNPGLPLRVLPQNLCANPNCGGGIVFTHLWEGRPRREQMSEVHQSPHRAEAALPQRRHRFSCGAGSNPAKN